MFHAKNQAEQPTPSGGKTSIVGQGVLIRGQIRTEADIRIDGRVEGDISSSARVVIGTGGKVQGNIHAQQCDITGSVEGNLVIQDLLMLRENAEIKGDITAGKLSMEPSVVFNGKCIMGPAASPIVTMKSDQNERKAAAE